ncbi:hypothetical protein ACGFNY_30930 [Streptomyces chartreusis]|uniref:hypothetical protein n=1 Tax=Streptomyces chartreusis TaxID=1969 RepID=UPI0037221131
MKRRAIAVRATVVAVRATVVAVRATVVGVLATVVAGLALFAVPVADWDGHGNIERNEWNIPLTNLRVL